MSRRTSGLTLIETLAAVVLLTTLAGASLPLLQAAGQILAEARQPPPAAEDVKRDLEELLNRIVAQPDLLGMKDLVELSEVDELVVPWLQELQSGDVDATAERPASLLKVLHSDASEVDHVWLILSCEGENVLRWLEPPRDPDQSPRKGRH